MKRMICIAGVILLTSCGADNISAVTDTAQTETSSVTAIHEDTAETEITADEPVKLMSVRPDTVLCRSDDIAAAIKLKKLQSSLYYPDIVHDIGAYPAVFVAECEIRIQNLTGEAATFDLSRLGLMGVEPFYPYDSGEQEVGSGDTVSADVRFLCTIPQAAQLSEATLDGISFPLPEKFISDKIAKVIELQSADDIEEYCYKKYPVYSSEGYITIYSEPTAYSVQMFTPGSDEEGNYAVFEFSAYNRSDYAQLIEPGAFHVYTIDSDGKKAYGTPVAFTADEELMYEPVESGGEIQKMPTYVFPDFITMRPENPTVFYIAYNIPSGTMDYDINYNGKHNSEGYYAVPRAYLPKGEADIQPDLKKTELPDFMTEVPMPETESPYQENEVGYSDKHLDFTMRFLKADDMTLYPETEDQQQYRKQGYTVLHTEVTVTNKSEKEFTFDPSSLIIEVKRSGEMNYYPITTGGGLELVGKRESHSIAPGESFTIKINFAGPHDELNDFKLIRYHDYEKIKTPCTSIMIDDRNSIEKAVDTVMM